MKRSEMLQLLYGKLTKELLINKTSVYDSTEKILTFLEEQGMQPPLNVDSEGFSFFYEWEPEITQQTIDEALEHINKKGVRGEMEITE